MVQTIFDDLNPDTRSRWAYPDTGRWDPDRKTTEFCAAMAQWRAHGLLAFTLNLQGGSPEGYSAEQPWDNLTFESDGHLRAGYLARLEHVLETADTLWLVVILGLFYFGQAHRLKDEPAVIRAVEQTVGWILDRSYTNVLIEIANGKLAGRKGQQALAHQREVELGNRSRDIAKSGNTDCAFLVRAMLNQGLISPSAAPLLCLACTVC